MLSQYDGCLFMDKEFIAKAIIALTPVVLGGILFSYLSIIFYGLPNASYDVALTHYQAVVSSYAPLLPLINSSVRSLVGPGLYQSWFILMALVTCFILPYIAFYEVTRKHRYPIFFIYGTTIPIAFFITGTYPQAVVCSLSLFAFSLKEKQEHMIFFLAGLAQLFHSFGFLIVMVFFGAKLCFKHFKLG